MQSSSTSSWQHWQPFTHVPSNEIHRVLFPSLFDLDEILDNNKYNLRDLCWFMHMIILSSDSYQNCHEAARNAVFIPLLALFVWKLKTRMQKKKIWFLQFWLFLAKAKGLVLHYVQTSYCLVQELNMKFY